MPSIEQLQQLLQNEPNDPFLLYGIAQEHFKAGRLDDAVAWFDRTLGADPDHAYAYFHKARALQAAGRTAGAVTTLHAGVAAAKAARDLKALSELNAYLDELE